MKESDVDARLRTCAECGELLDRAGQFHPQAMCRLKQAYPHQSSWESLRNLVASLGVDLPARAPLVRDLDALRRDPVRR